MTDDEKRIALRSAELAHQEGHATVNSFAGQASFESAQRMAKALCSSSLVPKEFQNNVPNTLIAIELSSRIGVSVMQVMQHLHVIHGKPGWSSAFLIATVNASRRFSALKYRWQNQDGHPEWGCRAVAKDLEDDEECVGTLVTMRMAEEEGWSKKPGSKWKTMPEQMLRYRAAAFWVRTYAPELSLGMQTVEEVQDISNATSAAQAIEVPGVVVGGATSELDAALEDVPESDAVQAELEV